MLPGLVTFFSRYQCLLLWWWWTHWHEIPSFPRLWPAYPLSLSPWQLRNKLQAAPSLLYPAEWKFICDISSFTFQTPAMTWPLVSKCHEVCQCLCCMDDDTQTAQWWGLMVYVSAVGSAASAWAGRVSITFITCVGWEMLDWFWIGTHSYTLTSFIKPKPLALLHCHWFHDIHHANTSPTYYIILDIICQENMTLPVIMVTASLLTGNGRSARLLYLLTFSSLRQVGRW